MDIIGRYIGIWVTREEMEAIFGFDPTSDSSMFMLGGKVLGESDRVGLWIEKPRRLIRWEFIHSAELFDKKEDAQGVVDFRPLAA